VFSKLFFSLRPTFTDTFLWGQLWGGALTRDRPIYRPIFGFYRYIGIGQNGRFYRPRRCWQNAIIFLTHPNNLRKKAQRNKSRQKQSEKINHEARVGRRSRNKTIIGSFAMLEATTCRCCERINSRCTSGSFRSTKSLTVT